MTRGKKQAPAKASRGDAPDTEFSLQNRLRPRQRLDYPKMAKTNSLAVELAKLNEITELLWLPNGLSKQTREARIIKTIDQFQSIKLTDATKSILVTR